MREGNQETDRRTATARAVQLALTRHQLRREQGIPTLGVLIGSKEEAEAAWREWAQGAGWHAAVWEVSEASTAEETAATALLYVFQEPDRAADAGATGAKDSGPVARTAERLWRTLDAADPAGRKRPLALAVPPDVAARFLGAASLDRVQTFFAEGVVILPAGVGKERSGAGAVGTPGAEEGLVQSAPSLARLPLQAATLAAFNAVREELRRVEAGSADPEEADRARSAAERFLADLLDELPDTRGLFELNARLDFCFGVKRAEVDLLAAGLRLAVEIDGYYHFRDPEGYRRDRRKDALLQRRGYLVLRFLAEDVVTRLEAILEEIRGAVAFRRTTGR